jgi:hypothetical protein
MDMYRIEGQWVDGRTSALGQTFELVAGLTEKSHIAGGNWFGAVRDIDTIYPFVLTDDGYCRYAGGDPGIHYSSIMKRPVQVGKIFEITLENNKDLKYYRITKIARLNIKSGYADAKPQTQKMLRVSWHSGNEFIDISEVKKYRNIRDDCKIYTSEVRKDGQIVRYTPMLRWLTEDRFTLEYDNLGKFESGADANGDLGLATYSLQNKTWTCIWECEEDGWDAVGPDCILLDTSNEASWN